MMKLSVLIPTYNYRCYTLVADLHRQLQASGIEYEVIVAEDGSRDQVSIISNHRIDELPNCRHIIRRQNVGRSAIRNFLADEACGEWLLFMDSDGLVVREDFVQRYLQSISPAVNVVCGGMIHSAECPSPEQSLRWKYEKAYENNVGKSDSPFRSFCFLIRHSVFDEIRFDQSYSLYGHEDAQFGICLKQRGYVLTSIDNPLQNADIEKNAIFLAKTEESIRTAWIHRDSLRGELRIIDFAESSPVRYFRWLIQFAFLLSKGMMRRNLLGTNPRLGIFAAYKLGYYLTLG